MAPATYFLLVSFLALVTSQAIASDPSPLQDFCVADIHSLDMHALTLSHAVFLFRDQIIIICHNKHYTFYVCPNIFFPSSLYMQ